MKRNTSRRERHRRTIARGKPACHWCSEPIDYDADWLDPYAYQIDHVIPLNTGGLDILDNIVPSHRKCNREKSDNIIHPAGIDYVTERTW
jgi:5-methylcytosine-specific restriction endonuclease McrA